MAAGGTNRPSKSTNESNCSSCCGNKTQDVSPVLPPKPLYAADMIKPVPGKNPSSRAGFLCSFLVDARGGAMTGHRHWGMRLVIPPGAVMQPTRINCRYQPLSSLKFPPPFLEREALASRVIEISPATQTFRSPVLIEIPHFASNAGAERETVILRSNDGETWSQHVSDTVEDGEIYQDVVTSVTLEESELERIYDALEVTRGRVVRVLTSTFPKYFAIITRIREEVRSLGVEGGKVALPQDPRCRATFPKNAVHKKIKVGLQVQTITSELVQAAFGRSVDVSKIIAIEPRKRKFHQPIFVSIPLPCSPSKLNNSTNIRLMCSVTSCSDPATWEDMTGSTPLELNKDVVHFSTKVSALFWLVVIHDNQRDASSALTLATRLYEESRLVPYLARISIFYREKFPKAWVDTLRIYCMTDDKAEKVVQSLQGFRPLVISREVEVTSGSKIAVKLGGNILQLSEDPFTRELIPVSTIRSTFVRETFTFTAFQENTLTLLVQPRESSKPLQGSLTFYRKLSNISKTQNLLLSHININTDGESGEDIKEDMMFHAQDEFRVAPQISQSENEHCKQDRPLQDRPLPKLLESDYEEVKKPNYTEEDLYEKIEVKSENGRTTLSKVTGNKVAQSLEKTDQLTSKIEPTDVPVNNTTVDKNQAKQASTPTTLGKTKEEIQNANKTKAKAEKVKDDKQKNKGEKEKKKDEDEKSFKKSTSSLNKLKNVSLFQRKDKSKTKLKSYEKDDLESMRKNFATAQGVKSVEQQVEPRFSKPPAHPNQTKSSAHPDQTKPPAHPNQTKPPAHPNQTKDKKSESAEQTLQADSSKSKVESSERPKSPGLKSAVKAKSFKSEDLEAMRQGYAVSQGVKKVEAREEIASRRDDDSLQTKQESTDQHIDTVSDNEIVTGNVSEILENTEKFEPAVSEKVAYELTGASSTMNDSADIEREVVEEICVETRAAQLTTECTTETEPSKRKGSKKGSKKNRNRNSKNSFEKQNSTEVNQDDNSTEITQEACSEQKQTNDGCEQEIIDHSEVKVEPSVDCTEGRIIPIQVERNEDTATMITEDAVDSNLARTISIVDETKTDESKSDANFVDMSCTNTVLDDELKNNMDQTKHDMREVNDDLIGFDVKQDVEKISNAQPFPKEEKEIEIKKKEKKKSFIKEWQEDLKEFFGMNKKKSAKTEGDKPSSNDKDNELTVKSNISNDKSEYEPLINQSRDMLESMKKEYTEIEKEKTARQVDGGRDIAMENRIEPELVPDQPEEVKREEKDAAKPTVSGQDETEVKVTKTKRSRKNRRKTNSGNYEENAKIMQEVQKVYKSMEEESKQIHQTEVEQTVVEEQKSETSPQLSKSAKKKRNKKKNKDKEESKETPPSPADVKERSVLAAGGKPKVVVPTPKGIPKPKPISRITDSNSNRNSWASNDSFTDEDLVEIDMKARARSIQDSEEFKKAVDSFDEIFRSESGTEILQESRRFERREEEEEDGGTVVETTVTGLLRTDARDGTWREESRVHTEVRTEFDTTTTNNTSSEPVLLDVESVKNVDGNSRQRKGSARFLRKQSSRSNRGSIGSAEETVDSERISPDLTTRLVETNDQMQRLDETFRFLCDEVQSSVKMEDNDQHSLNEVRAEGRGHSLTRTRVKKSEGPLDEMIEAMIQPPKSSEVADSPIMYRAEVSCSKRSKKD